MKALSVLVFCTTAVLLMACDQQQTPEDKALQSDQAQDTAAPASPAEVIPQEPATESTFSGDK